MIPIVAFLFRRWGREFSLSGQIVTIVLTAFFLAVAITWRQEQDGGWPALDQATRSRLTERFPADGKVVIVRNERDDCKRLATDLSESFFHAGWIQPLPPGAPFIPPTTSTTVS